MPEIKGRIGEHCVSATLSVLPDNEYIVLNDVILEYGNSTTQIDHIVVSIYGIFVIETKNYKGRIYGNANKRYWTQYIKRFSYELYNPIWQNEAHTRMLRRILKNYNGPYIPAVVFVGTSSLHISGGRECILWLNELTGYIKEHKVTVMDFSECRYIADFLSAFGVDDAEIRSRHKMNVYKSARRHTVVRGAGFCPRCGGRLVERSGRYGIFYGCSNYPQCRYTS